MASSSSSPEQKNKNMILLKTLDNELLEVEKEVAIQSTLIKKLLEDVSSNDTIPLPNVTATILSKVIDYCRTHASETLSEDDVQQWDSDFLKEIEVDQDILLDIILAANYLNIKSLQNLTRKCVADFMKGKTAQEIQLEYTLTFLSDYKLEEEEAISKEFLRAFSLN